MGVYRPAKDAKGQEIKNEDGSLKLEVSRRDPTTAEVQTAMRQQYAAETRNKIVRSGAERRYLNQPVAPQSPPPPTPEELAASQTPLPQPPPIPQVEAPTDPIPEPVAPAVKPEPPTRPKRRKKPKAAKGGPGCKGTPEFGLEPRECAYEECQKGPGGLRKAFRPYRRYERFCSDDCRDMSRKKKARERYHAKKAAKKAK